MPRLFARSSPARSSGGERGPTDDQGRLGGAALIERDASEGALVLRPGSSWRRTVPPVGTLP
jgi:hypothetical protein